MPKTNDPQNQQSTNEIDQSLVALRSSSLEYMPITTYNTMRPSSSNPLCLLTAQGAVDDFDRSESSFQVSDLPKSSFANTDNHARHRRRRVRFDLSENQFYYQNKMCAEDLADCCWYNRQEFADFRMDTLQNAKEVILFDREFCSGWDSYQNVLTRVYETCLESVMESTQLDPEDAQAFSRYVSSMEMRIGLERSAVRKVGRDKMNRRKALLETMISVQEDLDCQDDVSLAQRQEILSFTCREITRPSRLFATFLAQAQAFVEEDNSNSSISSH